MIKVRVTITPEVEAALKRALEIDPARTAAIVYQAKQELLQRVRQGEAKAAAYYALGEPPLQRPLEQKARKLRPSWTTAQDIIDKHHAELRRNLKK